jgi:hypothetical protein
MDVTGLTSGVAAVVAGTAHTCVLTTAGGVLCWGANSSGQLGDGTTAGRPLPTPVSGLTAGVAAIAAGNAHACAVTTSGGVKCWGLNLEGQLGDGTTSNQPAPVDVAGLGSGVAAATAGNFHTCALTAAGGVKCWGRNADGELGDGTTTRRLTAVDVSGQANWISAVVAGSEHTCALTRTGAVRCWGANYNGQLGNGGTSPRRIPGDVPGFGGGATAIAAGHAHTCAVMATGSLSCWGWNFDGQLGDGTTQDRLTGTPVVGLIASPGTVTSTPAGIECGSTCTASFDPGTVMTLTSTPASGYLFQGWRGACAGTGPCTLPMAADLDVQAIFAPVVPGPGEVSANPYGALAVTGATLTGTTLTGFSGNAVIQLGPVAGVPGSAARIELQGLHLGPGNALTIRAGAPGQTVLVVDSDPNGSAIAGALVAEVGNGAPPPVLQVINANGITVLNGGSIAATAGLVVDALGASWLTGQAVVNAGTLDGGASLELHASRINGGGAFKGNGIILRTFGHANNPVNGADFLANGLQLYPSNGSAIALTLNAYGDAPQVLNLRANGNATVWMPSFWPTASYVPFNNQVVPPAGARGAAVPDPTYGGGSILVQATGNLTLRNGGSNDFAFPGGIVLKAGGDLNVNGVVVNQGWTTSGKSFQGVFFEAPNIVSSGNIQVFGNNLNWVNFSTAPHAPVRTYSLARNAQGNAAFVTADATVPHLNTYSLLIDAAAGGQCWVCLVNTQPASLY